MFVQQALSLTSWVTVNPPQMVMYPSTNWAQCKVTTLIKTNSLPLSHSTTTVDEVYSTYFISRGKCGMRKGLNGFRNEPKTRRALLFTAHIPTAALGRDVGLTHRMHHTVILVELFISWRQESKHISPVWDSQSSPFKRKICLPMLKRPKYKGHVTPV